MSIEIKEVRSKRDLKTFIYLPELIHANHKNWLPPLYMDEWKFFSEKKNSLFQQSDTILFLVFENNKAVGRVMGIIPHHYNEKHRLKNARFSFMECYENIKIFKALITAVENWAKNKGCTELIGPMAFSDKEPQGFLTKGFEDECMMVTNHSFSYMVDYILNSGFLPHVDLCQYELPITNKIVERYQPLAKRVEERNGITVHEFSSTREVRRFVKPVFKLINNSYQDIYGFSPLTDEEAKEFSNRFLPLLDPKLIKVISNANGQVIAFVVAMADLSKGIKKARGRLIPFGWFHILRAGKKSKRLVLLLGAISEEARNKGMDAVLGVRLISDAIKKGFTSLDSHLIMKENYNMRREIERLENYRLYKEYRIFRKDIG